MVTSVTSSHTSLSPFVQLIAPSKTQSLDTTPPACIISICVRCQRAVLGETCPIAKHNDIKQYGDYRMRRMLLDLSNQMQHARDTGEPYQTLLAPPLGDLCVA